MINELWYKVGKFFGRPHYCSDEGEKCEPKSHTVSTVAIAPNEIATGSGGGEERFSSDQEACAAPRLPSLELQRIINRDHVGMDITVSPRDPNALAGKDQATTGSPRLTCPAACAAIG
jgi:hypothetical protein